jgi:hypothetical protein
LDNYWIHLTPSVPLHHRFCRKYADLHDVIQSAIANYVADVKAGSFPAEEHTYAMAAGEEEKLAKVVRPE